MDNLTKGFDKTLFYIVYEYGMDGRWGLMHADSEDQISTKYPEVAVMRDRPAWMTGDLYKKIEENNSFDIDDEPRGG